MSIHIKMLFLLLSVIAITHALKMYDRKVCDMFENVPDDTIRCYYCTHDPISTYHCDHRPVKSITCTTPTTFMNAVDTLSKTFFYGLTYKCGKVETSRNNKL